MTAPVLLMSPKQRVSTARAWLLPSVRVGRFKQPVCLCASVSVARMRMNACSLVRMATCQVVIFRDGKYLTLKEVFESLELTG